MAVSQSDIDALNAAIAGGERVVQLDGKRVEYRGVAELIQARNDLQAQLTAANNAASGTTRPRQTRLAQGGRGY